MTPLGSGSVSSLASAPERAAPGDSRAMHNGSVLRLGLGSHGRIAAALAAGLVLVTFVTKAGDDLAPNTWTQIVLTLIGAAAAMSVLVLGATGRPPPS